MKFVILALVIAQTFNLKANKITQEASALQSSARTTTDQWLYGWSDWYYSSPAVYYSWGPSYYDFYAPAWGYWYWRAEGKESTEKKVFSVEEAQKEIKTLKKEIWGKEDFNTETLRSLKKVYDPKWLIAQLRIARVVMLEDMVKQPSTGADNTGSEKGTKKKRREC